MITPALEVAVQRAYTVFESHKAPRAPLNVCTACCMSPDLEQEMRSLPLKALTTRHFYEYSTGAMGDLVQPVEETKYLLPRLLDLLARGEETNHSLELALDRVGRCPAGAFNSAERAAIDAFAFAFFQRSVDLNVEVGAFLYDWDSPLAALIMAHIGGCDVQPLLNYWTHDTHVQSTTRFVVSTYWNFWAERKLSSAFATDRLDLQEQFSAWMNDAATRKVFANKLLHPEFLARIYTTHLRTRVPFDQMVDAVLGHLSE